MGNYEDKRNFYRMMINTEVNVTIIDNEVNNQVVATCRDLSATGAALEMQYPLTLGKQVRVDVASPTESVQALNLIGKVQRVTKESEDCFLVVITIVEID
jgi:hypothetical protein